MCANSGYPTSRDRELRHKKHEKLQFLACKFINLPITQKPLGLQT